MDKMREDFEKWINDYFESHIDLAKSKNGDYIDQYTHDMWQACKSRDEEIKKLKAANLLPIEKVCPECEGEGGWPIFEGKEVKSCNTCHGSGLISVYYTPKQYKEITGKDLPESAPVYCKGEFGWADCRPYYVAKIQGWKTIICANESGKPPSDYRPEE